MTARRVKVMRFLKFIVVLDCATSLFFSRKELKVKDSSSSKKSLYD